MLKVSIRLNVIKKFKAVSQNKQGRKQENGAVFHFLS